MFHRRTVAGSVSRQQGDGISGKVVIGVKVALRTRSGRGQAGMCGSFGTIYSNIEDSDIDSVYTDRFWYRAKMTGIKLNGTIDVLIWGNRAHDAFIGA